MIAYKLMDNNMTCRGFQYKIGETYKTTDEVSLCNNGFHACLDPIDCFYYYNNSKGDKRMFVVELSGDIKSDSRRADPLDDDLFIQHIERCTKLVASEITILKEIDLSNFVTNILKLGKVMSKTTLELLLANHKIEDKALELLLGIYEEEEDDGFYFYDEIIDEYEYFDFRFMFDNDFKMSRDFVNKHINIIINFLKQEAKEIVQKRVEEGSREYLEPSTDVDYLFANNLWELIYYGVETDAAFSLNHVEQFIRDNPNVITENISKIIYDKISLSVDRFSIEFIVDILKHLNRDIIEKNTEHTLNARNIMNSEFKVNISNPSDLY